MTVLIDGSYGEGGGQILRSALALSAITGKPCRIDNIRAGRKNPGLQNQHLVAVRAAAQVADADMTGDAIGSSKLSFEPGTSKPGHYEFRIGTAGSTSLVLQTILPMLMVGNTSSSILLEGGTHNPMAPPFDFLQKTFLPLIGRIGPKVDCQIEKFGFYPKGGGQVQVRIEPVEKLKRLDIGERGEISSVTAVILLVNLPRHVAERENRVLLQTVPLLSSVEITESTKSPGAGNMVAVHVDTGALTETITALGERGVRAETVAESAAASVKAYLAGGAAVGEHLCDQLLLPMALAGGGSFITTTASDHAKTNIKIIQEFLEIPIAMKRLSDALIRIDIG